MAPSLRSYTTMCLTTNTSQGITTSLHTRVQPLLRVGHPWGTPLTPTANTTLHRPTPASTTHLSTPPPTSRTTTPPPPHLNPTPSPYQPPTPPPPPPPGPGSASRSRRRSPSPTRRRAGRLNRPTLRPRLASTCHAPNTRLRQVPRAGTRRTPGHKVKTCTLTPGTRGVARGLEEESTRLRWLREGWRAIRRGEELHRILLISPAR